MRVLIAGGCKNGKSYYAQELAKSQQKEKLYYIATMQPCDEEDRERVKRHQLEREGWGFETIECPRDISKHLARAKKDASFLLDSTTALLSNEMFDRTGQMQVGVVEKIGKELVGLLEEIQDIVIVSDYIYSDAFLYDEGTTYYRKGLADLDRLLAQHCDVVLEVVYSSVIVHKGKELYDAVCQKDLD